VSPPMAPGAAKKRTLGAAHLLLISFAAAIAVGTVLLWLPVSTRGEPISLLDALFTATSAVCVTGLIVVDTGAKFSHFGHVVIIALIQAGGLGIMTFSTLIFIALGQRAGLRQGNIIRDDFSVGGPVSPRKLVVWIVIVTLAMEAVGAVLLFWPMASREGASAAHALKSSIFHSVSAFCNAGFSLYDTSMTEFRTMWLMNITVTGLIIIGGIGFPVMTHLVHVARQRIAGTKVRVNLHARLALIATGVLLGVGLVLFLLNEGTHEMRGLPFWERMWASWFQSVTTRTAGFNTIDFAKAHEGSLFASSILMFIGGCPGSTAGGVKATTFAVIVVLIISMFRERGRAEVLGRTLPQTVIRRAMVVVALEVALVVAVTVVLLLTQRHVAWPGGKGPLACLVFEVCSAFGTVGLSTGITGQLNSLGKLVIIAAMFIGRLGPLALVQSIAGETKRAGYEYPEENAMVG